MEEAAINQIRSFIDKCYWTWAKTYVSVPHEYIVRGRCALTNEEFEEFVKAQREYGVEERWHKYVHPYLYVDGWKYWTMGDPIEETTVINRQMVFRPFDAKQLIRDFVEERLGGHIESLATYELRFLEGDEKYGNPGRGYDSDDTELMRAIYCVVFEDAWPNLNENLQMYKLRGDTLNTFATMFGKVRGDYRPEVHPGLDRHNPPTEIVKCVEDFYHVCWTMGNMTVLPNAFFDNHTMNTYRGCHEVWHDYEDRFLMGLYLALIDGEPKDEGLVAHIKANGDFFKPYYGQEGWRRFIDLHFLHDYVDEDYNPIISSKGYFYWRTWYMTDEQYFEEVKRYCAFATKVIENRAKRMIDVLKIKMY